MGKRSRPQDETARTSSPSLDVTAVESREERKERKRRKRAAREGLASVCRDEEMSVKKHTTAKVEVVNLLEEDIQMEGQEAQKAKSAWKKAAELSRATGVEASADDVKVKREEVVSIADEEARRLRKAARKARRLTKAAPEEQVLPVVVDQEDRLVAKRLKKERKEARKAAKAAAIAKIPAQVRLFSLKPKSSDVEPDVKPMLDETTARRLRKAEKKGKKADAKEAAENVHSTSAPTAVTKAKQSLTAMSSVTANALKPPIKSKEVRHAQSAKAKLASAMGTDVDEVDDEEFLRRLKYFGKRNISNFINRKLPSTAYDPSTVTARKSGLPKIELSPDGTQLYDGISLRDWFARSTIDSALLREYLKSQGVTMKEGDYTPGEGAIIENALDEWANSQSIDRAEVLRIISLKDKRSTNAFWFHVTRSLEWRNNLSCANKWYAISSPNSETILILDSRRILNGLDKFAPALRGVLANAMILHGYSDILRVDWPRLQTGGLAKYSEGQLRNAWTTMSKAAQADGVSSHNLRGELESVSAEAELELAAEQNSVSSAQLAWAAKRYHVAPKEKGAEPPDEESEIESSESSGGAESEDEEVEAEY
ncbi:hypothetical protein P7C70_g3830, partial [Phenoliferia sp. Uapishka_3]